MFFSKRNLVFLSIQICYLFAFWFSCGFIFPPVLSMGLRQFPGFSICRFRAWVSTIFVLSWVPKKKKISWQTFSLSLVEAVSSSCSAECVLLLEHLQISSPAMVLLLCMHASFDWFILVCFANSFSSIFGFGIWFNFCFHLSFL